MSRSPPIPKADSGSFTVDGRRSSTSPDPGSTVQLARPGRWLVDLALVADLTDGQEAVIGGDDDSRDAGVEQPGDRGVEHFEDRVEGPPAGGELVRFTVGVDLGRPNDNER